MGKAKENVMKNYPVVGVLENFNQTLHVLEQILPQYFKGATEAFYNPVFKMDRFSNVDKKPVRDEVKAIVRSKLAHEVEFYEFCKERLSKQYQNVSSI